MECVAAFNPGSSSSVVPVSFNNIPYTSNVKYLLYAWEYQNGSFTVGQNYNLLSGPWHKYYTSIIIIDEHSNVSNVGFDTWTLNSTTLSGQIGTRYANWMLAVLEM